MELDLTPRQRHSAALAATWFAEQQGSGLTVLYTLLYGAAALITVQTLQHADVR